MMKMSMCNCMCHRLPDMVKHCVPCCDGIPFQDYDFPFALDTTNKIVQGNTAAIPLTFGEPK
jgi:hypothetical protein